MASRKRIRVKTGEKAPVSGQYRHADSALEVTMTKGERLPPVRSGSAYFILVDRTKHRRPRR